MDRVREYGPDEFRDWLAEVSEPEEKTSQRVSDEMAFMLRAGGEVSGLNTPD